FTLGFDPQLFGFESFTPGFLASENVGLRFKNEGKLTFSWHQATPASLPDNAVLFEIHGRTQTATSTTEIFQIVPELTPAEAYRKAPGTTDEYEFKGVELEYADHPARDQYALYANIPNPFTDHTRIGFYVPAPTPVAVTVMDASGRIVVKKEGYFESGFHEFEFSGAELPTTGVLFYRMETPEFSDTKKMIRE
ncbi:MAG: T9SS C-terminal target domain-containing protein, partial [Bacteroidetes bacterium]